MTLFMLTDDHPEYGRLKSFSSTTKGEKTTIRLEVELESVDELSYVLRSLLQLKKAHAAKPQPAPKPKAPEPRQIAAERRLALPPPERD